MFLTHIANISGKVREESLDGRDYWVVPLTILREGVLNGSRGPVFYPHKQNRKFAYAWNSKPIVVYHPEDDMDTASNPEYIESNAVGFLLKNEMRGRDQVCEGWIDQKKADKVDFRIRRSIENGMDMEVSTGLDADLRKESGRFFGRKYKHIAENYRPDHLALLPDQIGACSLADGCGMFTANKAVGFKKMKRIQKTLNAAVGGKEKPMRNCSCQKKKGSKSMKTKNKRKKLTSNARKTIRRLIEDQTSPWTEKDRKKLEAMDESILEKLMPSDGKKVGNRRKASRAERMKEIRNELRKEDRRKRRRAKLANKGKSRKPASVKDFLRQAPPEIRSVLRNAMSTQKETRKRLYKVILANRSNHFTRDELKDMDDNILNKLAAVANSRSAKKTRRKARPTSSFSFFGQQAVANTRRSRRMKNAGRGKGMAPPPSSHVVHEDDE